MRSGERLAAELRRAWNGAPWHGPSVQEVLRRLTARQAAHRRARGSHTPWELVLHLTTWVEVPLRRLDDAAYAPADDEDFPSPASTSDDQWAQDLARLAESVERLAARVESWGDLALEQPVGERGYTYTRMIDGVVQHLAYHAGQIAVLARSEEVAGVVAPPPLIIAAAAAVAELAQRVWRWPTGLSPWLGLAVAALGLALIWWAHRHFIRAHTSAAPWHPSRALIVSGPFRYTRNPMYVGMLVTLAGAGFARGNTWYLAALLPAWGVLHWGVVRREERYLLRRFGVPYQQLLERSRRWLV